MHMRIMRPHLKTLTETITLDLLTLYCDMGHWPNCLWAIDRRRFQCSTQLYRPKLIMLQHHQDLK
jgi:hypothetical protein